MRCSSNRLSISVGRLSAALACILLLASTCTQAARTPTRQSAKPGRDAGLLIAQQTTFGRLFRGNPDVSLDAWRNDQGIEFKFGLKHMFVDWRSERAKAVPFRWSTKSVGVEKAVWQVCTVRNTANRQWKTAAGLVASGEVSELPLPNGFSVFPIDFTKFTPPAPKQAPPSTTTTPPATASGTKRPSRAVAGAAGRTKMGATAGASRTRRSRDTRVFALKSAVKLDQNWIDYSQFLRTTYYVRLVQLDEKDRIIGTPSESVVILYGQPDTRTVRIYDPAETREYEKSLLPIVKHPKVTFVKYNCIQPDKANQQYHFVCTDKAASPMGLVEVGTPLNFTPKDKTWWESFQDGVSDAFGFLTNAMNWVSATYDKLKQLAVSWAPAWMQGPLLKGLDIGLTMMGIPPSLPNFDELASMGRGYLMAQLAASGPFTAEQCDMAVTELVKQVKKMEGNGGNPKVWFKPDPDWFYRPAYIVVEVENTGTEDTDPVYLSTSFRPVGSEDASNYIDDLFYAGPTFIPRLAPGTKFTLPVYLEENKQGRYDDTDPNAGELRFKARYGGQVEMNVCTTRDKAQNPYENEIKLQFKANKDF